MKEPITDPLGDAVDSLAAIARNLAMLPRDASLEARAFMYKGSATLVSSNCASYSDMIEKASVFRKHELQVLIVFRYHPYIVESWGSPFELLIFDPEVATFKPRGTSFDDFLRGTPPLIADEPWIGYWRETDERNTKMLAFERAAGLIK